MKYSDVFGNVDKAIYNNKILEENHGYIIYLNDFKTDRIYIQSMDFYILGESMERDTKYIEILIKQNNIHYIISYSPYITEEHKKSKLYYCNPSIIFNIFINHSKIKKRAEYLLSKDLPNRI